MKLNSLDFRLPFTTKGMNSPWNGDYDSANGIDRFVGPGRRAVKTIHAVYENGVFRPTEPIELPEGTEVEICTSSRNGAGLVPREPDQLDAVYEILGRRHRSGRPDTAERHNEHQP